MIGISSLLDRFRKSPVQSTLLSCIFALHFFFILIILVSPDFAFRKKQHKPMIVKTIIAKPADKITPTVKKNLPAPQIAPLRKTEPTAKNEAAKPQPKPPEVNKPINAKKEIPKPLAQTKKDPAIADKIVTKSKPAPVSKTPPAQNRAKISDALLRELEESIAKMESKSDKAVASAKSPVSRKAFAPILLQIDNPIEDDKSGDGEDSYTDTLVNHLHQSLSLPEYGEVKIQLSLRQDGTIVKMIVLKTQSEKNKQYLESHLPRMKFPRFEGAYANKKEFTFILTFCNE